MFVCDVVLYPDVCVRGCEVFMAVFHGVCAWGWGKRSCLCLKTSTSKATWSVV